MPDIQRSRLLGVDAARGVALVGMIAVHLAPATPVGSPPALADVLAGGRASALFAVLAGCGLALATGGPAPWTGRRLGAARRAVAGRAAVVAALGLTLGLTPTPVAVILAYYGVLFLVALPVLGWGPRALAVTAGVCAVVGPVVSHLLRRALPRGPGPNVSWSDVVDDPGGLARALLLDGYYPVLTWSAYLLLGLAVGRLRLRSAPVAAAVAAAGTGLALAGLAIGGATLAAAGGPAVLGATNGETAAAVLQRLAGSSYGTSPTTSWWWLGTAGRHSGTGPDLLHTGGSALAVLGVLLLAGLAARDATAPRAGAALGRLLVPLAAVGATTLTIYTLHASLLAATAGRPWVTGLPPGALLAGHLGMALAVAAAARAPRRRGPLEALTAASARAAAGTTARLSP